jgi:hypothetical protein
MVRRDNSGAPAGVLLDEKHCLAASGEDEQGDRPVDWMLAGTLPQKLNSFLPLVSGCTGCGVLKKTTFLGPELPTPAPDATRRRRNSWRTGGLACGGQRRNGTPQRGRIVEYSRNLVELTRRLTARALPSCSDRGGESGNAAVHAGAGPAAHQGRDSRPERSRVRETGCTDPSRWRRRGRRLTPRISGRRPGPPSAR